jgi:hypothetical protein
MFLRSTGEADCGAWRHSRRSTEGNCRFCEVCDRQRLRPASRLGVRLEIPLTIQPIKEQCAPLQSLSHVQFLRTLRKLRFELVRRMMSDGDLARADELRLNRPRGGIAELHRN